MYDKVMDRVKAAWVSRNGGLLCGRKLGLKYMGRLLRDPSEVFWDTGRKIRVWVLKN